MLMDLTGFEDRLSEAFGHASRPKLAEKLGLNYQTLSNWLTGRTEFPARELAKIANLTDFSLNWILTGKGEKRTAHPAKPSIIDFEALDTFVREVVQDELKNTIGQLMKATPKEQAQEEDIGGEVSGIEPAERILAPVVAHIGPGDESGSQTIQEEDIEEIRKRLQPRSKKTG